MKGFNAAAAASYDTRIRALAPGYGLAQELALATLQAQLPAEADILVAGCGVGGEMLVLAGAEPGWRFTGVDSSPEMIDEARARMADAGAGERVTWRVGPMEDAREQPHDAGLAFLVAHFLPDDGRKLAFFRAIAAALKPGAPLLVLDYDDAGPGPDAYRAWLRGKGHNAAAVEGVITRTTDKWSPVTPARKDALLVEAGFSSPVAIAQALAYRVVMAHRT